MIDNKKIPMPPVPAREFFIPLSFWTDLIMTLDKRAEMIAEGSGYGVIAIDVKLQNGKVYEVGIEEKTRLRNIVEKAHPSEK